MTLTSPSDALQPSPAARGGQPPTQRITSSVDQPGHWALPHCPAHQGRVSTLLPEWHSAHLCGAQPGPGLAQQQVAWGWPPGDLRCEELRLRVLRTCLQGLVPCHALVLCP